MQELRNVIISSKVPVFVIKLLESVGVLTTRENYIKRHSEKMSKELIDKWQEEYIKTIPIDKCHRC